MKKKDGHKHIPMGQFGSDPRPGDKSVPCKKCTRSTNMIGTRLCDLCWERTRRSI